MRVQSAEPFLPILGLENSDKTDVGENTLLTTIGERLWGGLSIYTDTFREIFIPLRFLIPFKSIKQIFIQSVYEEPTA